MNSGSFIHIRDIVNYKMRPNKCIIEHVVKTVLIYRNNFQYCLTHSLAFLSFVLKPTKCHCTPRHSWPEASLHLSFLACDARMVELCWLISCCPQRGPWKGDLALHSLSKVNNDWLVHFLCSRISKPNLYSWSGKSYLLVHLRLWFLLYELSALICS